jgi:ASCH domain
MKALTIWQPWASLIMIGAKPYEFRSWMAPRSAVGKEIVIHAGTRYMQKAEVEDLIERLRDPARAWTTGLVPELALKFLEEIDCDDCLPLGYGLGTATVGVSREGATIAAEMGGEYVNDSDRFMHSQFGWPLTEIKRWDEPVKMSGKQGLWNWPTPEQVGL